MSIRVGMDIKIGKDYDLLHFIFSARNRQTPPIVQVSIVGSEKICINGSVLSMRVSPQIAEIVEIAEIGAHSLDMLFYSQYRRKYIISIM